MKNIILNKSNNWQVVCDIWDTQEVVFEGTENEANDYYNSIRDCYDYHTKRCYNNVFFFAPGTGLKDTDKGWIRIEASDI